MRTKRVTRVKTRLESQKGNKVRHESQNMTRESERKWNATQESKHDTRVGKEMKSRLEDWKLTVEILRRESRKGKQTDNNSRVGYMHKAKVLPHPSGWNKDNYRSRWTLWFLGPGITITIGNEISRVKVGRGGDPSTPWEGVSTLFAADGTGLTWMFKPLGINTNGPVLSKSWTFCTSTPCKA